MLLPVSMPHDHVCYGGVLVRERPDIPLHNNSSESDIREYVKKRAHPTSAYVVRWRRELIEEVVHV